MSVESINLSKIGASVDRLSGLPLAQRPLRGFIHGEYITPQIGVGSDPDGVRPYEPGDDERHIEWNATARSTDKTIYYQEHYADRAPAFYVASDIPDRRYHATPGRNERELGIGIAVVASLMATRDNMPASMVWGNGLTFAYGDEPTRDVESLTAGFGRAVKLAESADKVAEDTRAGNSQGVLKKLMGRGKNRRETATQIPEQMYLKDVLNKLSNFALKDSLVMVISDFRDVQDPRDAQHGWLPALRRVAETREVVAVELTNRWDFELPEEIDYFSDPRTGQIISIKDRPDIRAYYKTREQARSDAIHQSFRACRVGHVAIDTELVDWVGNLERQLSILRDAA